MGDTVPVIDTFKYELKKIDFKRYTAGCTLCEFDDTDLYFIIM